MCGRLFQRRGGCEKCHPEQLPAQKAPISVLSFRLVFEPGLASPYEGCAVPTGLDLVSTLPSACTRALMNSAAPRLVSCGLPKLSLTQTLAPQAPFLRRFALILLVSAFRFSQHSREAAAAEAESLLDASGHSDFRSRAWHAVALAVDPHSSGIIFQFKDPGAKRAERI